MSLLATFLVREVEEGPKGKLLATGLSSERDGITWKSMTFDLQLFVTHTCTYNVRVDVACTMEWECHL